LAVATAVGFEVCLNPLIIIPIHPLWVISFHFHVHQKAIEKLLSECIIYAEQIRQGVESFECPKESFSPTQTDNQHWGMEFSSSFLKNGENKNLKKTILGTVKYAFLHPIYLVQFLSLPTHHQL
jgi:hypothetical protein